MSNNCGGGKTSRQFNSMQSTNDKGSMTIRRAIPCTTTFLRPFVPSRRPHTTLLSFVVFPFMAALLSHPLVADSEQTGYQRHCHAEVSSRDSTIPALGDEDGVIHNFTDNALWRDHHDMETVRRIHMLLRGHDSGELISSPSLIAGQSTISSSETDDSHKSVREQSASPLDGFRDFDCSSDRLSLQVQLFCHYYRRNN